MRLTTIPLKRAAAVLATVCTLGTFCIAGSIAYAGNENTGTVADAGQILQIFKTRKLLLLFTSIIVLP